MMENVALERNKMIVRTYYGSGERGDMTEFSSWPPTILR